MDVSETTANLIEDRDATVALLSDPLSWRVRVVEELSVDAATSCLRRRSLQVAPLRDRLLPHLPDEATHALLALNIAPVPRGPLLDFDVSGPAGDAWLLPRIEIASRQSLYLETLANSYGKLITPELREMITAILGYTGEWFANATPTPLEEYLEAGLGRPVATTTINEWREVGNVCREILRGRLDVFRGYSAPENPALVLPNLFGDGFLTNDVQATVWLNQYRDLLIRLNDVAEPSTPNVADEFLVALADYANYYDLIVAMRVPLDEPFLIKFSERRDLRLSLFRNHATQELVVADALTNHVTFKIADPNIRIHRFRALKPGSDEYAYGAFQSRKDQQNRAFYAHDVDRDYRVQISFSLALLRRLQLVPYFVTILLVLLMVVLLVEQPRDLRTMAIVVGPAALAGSVLLFREPSTLGSRLRLLSSLILATALLTLVAVAAGLHVYLVAVTSTK